PAPSTSRIAAGDAPSLAERPCAVGDAPNPSTPINSFASSSGSPSLELIFLVWPPKMQILAERAETVLAPPDRREQR
ncbi:unnamed protein product, partial [Urochloa humidicola]